MIYAGGSIVGQGTFLVSDELNTNTLQSTDGGEFEFTHSTKDMVCDLEISYSRRGSVVARRNLAVAVNRSKIKWKRCELNGRYSIHYRCQVEDWDAGKLRKEKNKLRRRAESRGGTIVNITTERARD